MVLIIEKTGIIKRLRSHVTFKLVFHFLEFPGWRYKIFLSMFLLTGCLPNICSRLIFRPGLRQLSLLKFHLNHKH